MTADVFQELCLIGVKNEMDSSELQLAGFTEDISEIELGEKAMEGIALVNGGRIPKFTPQADGTFTIKCYPIGVAQDGNGVMHYFSGTALDSVDPYQVINSYSHKRNRIVLLWADTLPSTASGTTNISNGIAMRFTLINAYCTNVKHDFGDKMLSAEMSFKWLAFSKSGTANACYESTGGTGLSAVTATPTSTGGQW